MMLAKVADASEQGEVRAGDGMPTAPVGDDFVAVPVFLVGEGDGAVRRPIEVIEGAVEDVQAA